VARGTSTLARVPGRQPRRPGVREFGAATPAFADLNPAGPALGAGDRNHGGPAQAADAQRLSMLAQLGQLHRQGVLTDAEFAAQKAQFLSE
jgi:hypothetical protein